MIPAHELDNPISYAYVAGCRNAAWLVGKILEIDEEKRVIKINRSMNDNDGYIPINLEKDDRIPDFLNVGDSIKIIAHIYSGIQDENDTDLKNARHCRLVAKYLGRPTLLDMRPTENFSELEIDSKSFDDFELPDIYSPVSNNIEIAGFVDGVPALVRDNDSEKDRLVFIVRQSANPQSKIPVEIYGKHAAIYRRIVTVGMAVFVTGSISSRKRTDNEEYMGVVRSNHIRKAVPEKDFKFETVPDWVIEIRKRYQQQVNEAKARAAAEAMKRSLGVSEEI